MIREDKVIVLRKIKHGESDLIVHGLTKEGAKVSFFARGAAKSKKRFGGGVLEPTHYIKVNYHESKAENGLHQLNDAKVLEDFHLLRTDYERLETALYFVSVVDKISHEGIVDSFENFDLLGNALRAAERTQNLSMLKIHFQIRLLALQGVLATDEDMVEFLERPISLHEQLRIGEDQLKKIKYQAQHLLDQYTG